MAAAADAGPLPFRCPWCGQGFPDLPALEAHHRAQHAAERFEAPLPGLVRCGYCHRQFPRSSALRSHIKQKHVCLSYPCPLCSKGYVSPGEAQRHVAEYHHISLEYQEHFAALLGRCGSPPRTSPDGQLVDIGERALLWTQRVTPTRQQAQRVADLHARLRTLLSRPFPQCAVYFYGSLAQGTATAHSDVDVCLVPDPAGPVSSDTDPEDRAHLMRQVRAALRKSEFANCRIIGSNRSPIVTFQGSAAWPPFDIGLGFDGVRNSALVRQYVAADAPLLQPLLRLINRWSKSVGINSGQNSFFSSYALTLMLLHQRLAAGLLAPLPAAEFAPDRPYCPLPPLEEAPPGGAEPLAAALLAFVQYYGYVFDADVHVVQLQPPGPPATKAQKGWQAYAVAIEDPLDPAFNPAHQVTPKRWAWARDHFRVASHMADDAEAVAWFFAGMPTVTVPS
eukprot:EG_transcript_10831